MAATEVVDAIWGHTHVFVFAPAMRVPNARGDVSRVFAPAMRVPNARGDVSRLASNEIRTTEKVGVFRSRPSEAGGERAEPPSRRRARALGMTHNQEVKVQTRGPDGGNPTPKRQGR